MLSAGFEPAISAGERPQTHDLDRAATGISWQYIKGKGKVHPCTGTEALYRPYGL